MTIRSRWCLPVTKAGSAALVLAVVLGMAGVNAGVNVLYLLSATLIATVCVSILAARLAIGNLTSSRLLPAEVTAGEPFAAAITVTARSRLGGRNLCLEEEARSGAAVCRFEAYVASLGDRRHATATLHGVFPARGEYRFRPTTVTSLFPFGLGQARGTTPRADETVVVYPKRGRLLGPLPTAAGWREHAQREPAAAGYEGDEIRSVREYRDGDNPRRIHWRTTARMGAPYVREIEPERQPAVTVLLDAHVPSPSDPAQQEALELAISFAATLAEETIRVGGAVTLAALGRETAVVEHAVGGPGRQAVLRALAVLQPAREGDYAAQFARVAPALARAGAIVAIFPERETQSAAASFWPGVVRTGHHYVATDAGLRAVFVPPAAEATP